MQTAPPIPQTVARHVLHHFGADGGIQPGTFITRLIAAIDAADMVNTARLAEGFPEYVAAVVGAQMDPQGITNLQRIAAGEPAEEEQPEPQCPEALFNPDTDDLRRCVAPIPHKDREQHQAADGTQWRVPFDTTTEVPF